LNQRGREATAFDRTVHLMKDNNDNNFDQSDEDGKEESKNVAENGSSESLKRDSLAIDDFTDFDPDSLEAEDDWKDFFDDFGPTTSGSGTTLSSTEDNDSVSKPSGDDSTTDSINSLTLMPPPPPLKGGTSQGGTGTPSTTTTTTTTTTSTIPSNMPTTFSTTTPGIEALATNRPPLDHSITRRIKTAGTVDRRDSTPPSWHSEAADLPHRHAMVQDM
jgi:hypothetical protein